MEVQDPSGDWLYEIKDDGYRVQIHINAGKRTVYARNGPDWTKRKTTAPSTYGRNDADSEPTNNLRGVLDRQQRGIDKFSRS